MADMHCVYMLICSDRSLYTGYTNDMEQRLKAHNSGKGAKYTRGRGPCRVVYLETFPTRPLALKREYEIKRLSRKQKFRLIRNKLKEVVNHAGTEKL